MEVPRFRELNWSAAVFSGLKKVEVLIWWDVLGSFENVFGDKILGNYVYMLMC